jgi:hypothetical protein
MSRISPIRFVATAILPRPLAPNRSYEFLGKKVFGDADDAGWVDALGSAFA